jgi:Flp pilus assembly protein TadD
VTYNSLAWVLATAPKASTRDGKKAIDYAMKACELSNWTDSETVSTLAAAYAETGDFDNAIKWQRKYLEYPNLTGSVYVDDRDRLALYEARKPYHIEDALKHADTIKL